MASAWPGKLSTIWCLTSAALLLHRLVRNLRRICSLGCNSYFNNTAEYSYSTLKHLGAEWKEQQSLKLLSGRSHLWLLAAMVASATHPGIVHITQQPDT